jgi:hypothetical protein
MLKGKHRSAASALGSNATNEPLRHAAVGTEVGLAVAISASESWRALFSWRTQRLGLPQVDLLLILNHHQRATASAEPTTSIVSVSGQATCRQSPWNVCSIMRAAFDLRFAGP